MKHISFGFIIILIICDRFIWIIEVFIVFYLISLSSLVVFGIIMSNQMINFNTL